MVAVFPNQCLPCQTTQEYQNTKAMESQTERILCSAIWYKEFSVKNENLQPNPANVHNGLVFCGHRHTHCMHTMVSVTGLRSVEKEVGKSIQGFLTSKNRFVDRTEAAEIARSAGQVSSHVTYLYSEDLY